MAKLTNEEEIERRTVQIKKWLREGVPRYLIPGMAREKFGSGPAYSAVCAIAKEIGVKPKTKRKIKPKPPPEETALVIASPTGLVPAREVSPRLRAMIAKVADLMIEEGVLTVSIDGREVAITHVPDEQLFEV